MDETAPHRRRMPAFECRRCGACCRVPGHVVLREREPEAIAVHLGLTSADFHARYTRLTANRAGLSLTEQSDGACIFLSDRNICLIDPVKPEQCRTFPEVWRFAHAERDCPGLVLLNQKETP